MQKQDRIHFGVGAVAIPIAATGVAVLDAHPLLAKALFVIAGIAFVWGIWPFIFRRKRKKSKAKSRAYHIQNKALPKINYEKLQEVSMQDREIIQAMGIRMMVMHGHQDLTGLMSDRANGIPLNDLLEKPCSECGYPRNRRGKE